MKSTTSQDAWSNSRTAVQTEEVIPREMYIPPEKSHQLIEEIMCK